MDWTYDKYLEAIKIYGIEDNTNGEDYTAYFVSYMKRAAKKFLEKWKKEHNGKLYDHGYVGDAFKETLMDWFSDFYKDTFNQRPHLPWWFYIHPLGLPMSEDTARMFCADPMEDAADEARFRRNSMPIW